MQGVNDLSPLESYRHLATTQLIPMQASLELTYRCNERCTHCYLDTYVDDPGRVLSQEDWFKILHELRDAGTLYLILMGGEAMLSPYFWEICKKGSELNFHISMISNGLKINSLATAQKLRDCGLHVVTFSMYSLDPAIHDKMTAVRGSLAKLLQAIDFCQQVGIQVGINVLLTEANARGVFDIYEWCIDRKLEIKVDPTVTPKFSGDLAPTKLRASKETLQWFFRERSRRWPKTKPQSNGDLTTDFVCNAGKGKCAVNPYGELLPCIEIREPLGSLVTSSFGELWHSEKVQPWRNLRIGDLKNTGGLATYNFCDHCPGMALHEHGDGRSVTPFSQLMAKVRQEISEEGAL